MSNFGAKWDRKPESEYERIVAQESRYGLGGEMLARLFKSRPKNGLTMSAKEKKVHRDTESKLLQGSAIFYKGHKPSGKMHRGLFAKKSIFFKKNRDRIQKDEALPEGEDLF